MKPVQELGLFLIQRSDPVIRLDAWLAAHYDVGKRCGPTSQPCGDSCVPRKRNGKKVSCKSVTSSTAQEYNEKQRSAKAKELLAARQAKRSPNHQKPVEQPPIKQKSAQKKEQKPSSKVHSIKTQEDFDQLALHTLDKLNKSENLGGLVPVYKLRRAMGELVSRDKFNEFIREAQANGDLTLQGGSVEDSARDKIRDSVQNGLGKVRTYAKINPDALKKVKDPKALDEKLKDRPELDELGTARQLTKGAPIKGQKDFDAVVSDAAMRLNSEFGHNNSIPISQLRKALGDRISAKDFDNLLQNSDKVKGYEESPQPDPELEKGAVTSMMGRRRHYVKFEGLK